MVVGDSTSRLCYMLLNDTAPTEIYTYGHTLSLHVALPIWDLAPGDRQRYRGAAIEQRLVAFVVGVHRHGHVGQHRLGPGGGDGDVPRSVAERVDRKSTRLNSSH